jgi:cytoskeletal protein RodZ
MILIVHCVVRATNGARLDLEASSVAIMSQFLHSVNTVLTEGPPPPPSVPSVASSPTHASSSPVPPSPQRQGLPAPSTPKIAPQSDKAGVATGAGYSPRGGVASPVASTVSLTPRGISVAARPSSSPTSKSGVTTPRQTSRAPDTSVPPSMSDLQSSDGLSPIDTIRMMTTGRHFRGYFIRAGVPSTKQIFVFYKWNNAP